MVISLCYEDNGQLVVIENLTITEEKNSGCILLLIQKKKDLTYETCIDLYWETFCKFKAFT